MNDLPAVRLISANGICRDFRHVNGTPETNFLLLKDVCENWATSKGDSVLFSGHMKGGIYDQLDISRLAYFGGFGRDVSRLTTTAQHDALDDPATEVNPDKPARVAILMGSTTITNCTLENVPTNQQEDGALIGFPQAGAYSGALRNVTLIGQDWTFYHWAAAREGSRLLVEDCDVHFARQGFSQCGNNAHNSRWTLRRVNFHGDANNSVSLGDTSGMSEKCIGGLLGVVFRCGELLMEDCTFVEMIGRAEPYSSKYGVPRVVCITDTYSTAANKATVIRHRGTRFCDLVPGIATEAKFVDMNYGKCEEWRQGVWV